jgi:hypothetical protein
MAHNHRHTRPPLVHVHSARRRGNPCPHQPLRSFGPDVAGSPGPPTPPDTSTAAVRSTDPIRQVARPDRPASPSSGPPAGAWRGSILGVPHTSPFPPVAVSNNGSQARSTPPRGIAPRFPEPFSRSRRRDSECPTHYNNPSAISRIHSSNSGLLYRWISITLPPWGKCAHHRRQRWGVFACPHRGVSPVLANWPLG